MVAPLCYMTEKTPPCFPMIPLGIIFSFYQVSPLSNEWKQWVGFLLFFSFLFFALDKLWIVGIPVLLRVSDCSVSTHPRIIILNSTLAQPCYGSEEGKVEAISCLDVKGSRATGCLDGLITHEKQSKGSLKVH